MKNCALAVCIATLAGCTGTQTGGEGTSIGPCRPLDTTEVSADTARAMGFPVDRDLALFTGSSDVPFNGHPTECGYGNTKHTVDGRILFRAQLQSLSIYRSTPTSSEFVCPDQLLYRASVDLTTDDGTFSGHFDELYGVTPYSRSGYFTDATAIGLDAPTFFGARSEARNFTGSLDVVVDLSRPHYATILVEIGLLNTGPSGTLRSYVGYTTILQGPYDVKSPCEVGPAIFWPANDCVAAVARDPARGDCRRAPPWDPLSSSASSPTPAWNSSQGTQTMTLDEYNRVSDAGTGSGNAD